MKIKFDKETLLKTALIVAVLIVLPFSVELVFLVDLVGLEIVAIMLLVYMRSITTALQYHSGRMKQDLVDTCCLLSGLVMFEPKVYAVHLSLSGIFLLLLESILFAYIVWLPVMLLSSGYFM